MTLATTPRRRIALVAPARYPIREPYAGGLEAFCHTLVRAVRSLGHTVDLYAAAGSQGHVRDVELPGISWSRDPLRPATPPTRPGRAPRRTPPSTAWPVTSRGRATTSCTTTASPRSSSSTRCRC